MTSAPLRIHLIPLRVAKQPVRLKNHLAKAKAKAKASKRLDGQIPLFSTFAS
jgi:hypothetical protein